MSYALAPAQPWQFRPEDFGARGDGVVLFDGAMTAGSATLTSPAAKFTSGDVGKHVLVNEAGPTRSQQTSGALLTTITAVQSGTTVTLAVAASRAVTATAVCYGTDDTAAFQACVAAIYSSGSFTGPPRLGELLLRPVIYVLATPAAADALTRNAQVPLPVVQDTVSKTIFRIRGLGGDNSTFAAYHQPIPQLQGTVLFSMWEKSTGGVGSVIGGPQDTSVFATNDSYSNVLVDIDGIQITCPHNPGQIAVDLYRIGMYRIGAITITTFTSPTGTPAFIQPTNVDGMGLRTNYTGYNDRCDIESLAVEGYYVGMTADQHVACRRAGIIYTNTAVYFATADGTQVTHACWFGYLSAEINTHVLYSPARQNIFGLRIDLLDVEGAPDDYVYDTGNSLYGTVHVLPRGSSNVATDGSPVPVPMVGGGNLEVLSLASPRGAAAWQPGVPVSGTALVNPYARNAAVTVTGGTVTGISVDGAALGVISGTVYVPSGKSITLAYSTAPAWKWTVL